MGNVGIYSVGKNRVYPGAEPEGDKRGHLPPLTPPKMSIIHAYVKLI